ncbi:MAG: hypothetical protein PHH08_04340 [Candidatus ainarchaeum sp.]|nr:hypothetical protein [Candidatus ainarchaeum sp.]
MKIIEKEIHSLSNGAIFARLQVLGKRGEKISLEELGIKNKILVFYHEAPKNPIDCTHFPSENTIELGGSVNETKRSLYLIFGNT